MEDNPLPNLRCFTASVATKRFGFWKPQSGQAGYLLPNQREKINWEPNAGPQQLAIECEADELFYGGQAGGGKTDLLLGLALKKHYKAIIFRREYPQLTDIIERSVEIIGERRRYNSTSKIWRLQNGQTLEFGACQYEADKERYQGRPHDLKAFDEITHFTKTQYLYLSGWNRTTREGQRCRTVVTGNPPSTPEGEWVLERWGAWLDPTHKNPAKPGELRWYISVDSKDVEVPNAEPVEIDGETYTPRSRTFIPAALTDNPYLAGTGYEAVIDQLPEPLRAQLKRGDFGVGRVDDIWQVIPSAWVRAAMDRWNAVDAPEESLDCIGIDCARGGNDKMVLAKRYGTWFAPLIKVEGKRVPDGPTAAAVVTPHVEDDCAIHVDVIGIGSSVFDILKDNFRNVRAINVARKTSFRDRSKKLKMRNVRAEAYWRLREALDPVNGENLALPDDSELMADLCAPKFDLQVSGIVIEPKEDIKERIGRSPDCGDAVAMAMLVRTELDLEIY